MMTLHQIFTGQLMGNSMIESITNILIQLTQFNTALASYIPSVIGVFSVMAAFMPKPNGDGWLSKVHWIINRLAFNVGQAANK